MPFVFDYNPAYAANEAQAARDNAERQRNREMMLNALMTAGQSVAGIIQQDKGRAQEAEQFQSGLDQSQQKFLQDMQYRVQTRDQINERNDRIDGAAREMFKSVTGREAPLGADDRMLAPVTNKAIGGQIVLQNEPERLRMIAEAKLNEEQARYKQAAGTLAAKLPNLEQMGVLLPGESDKVAQYLQANPSAAADVDSMLKNRMVLSFQKEYEDLQDQQYGQRLAATAMDPANSGGFSDQEKQRALFAAKMIEGRLWTRDEGKLYTYTGQPTKQSAGTSAWERMQEILVGSGRVSPDEAMQATENRFRAQSTPPVIKDPTAIGEAGATVAQLEAQIKNFEERAKNETDDSKSAQYTQQAQKIRERLGDAKAAEARAKAGTKIKPTSSARSGETAASPPSQNGTTTAHTITKRDAVRMAAMELGKGATPEVVARRAREIFERKGNE